MVLLSLLVLNFPLVAFADTSDSTPASTVASSQEQVIEAPSNPNGVIVEQQEAASVEKQDSKESIVENKESTTEETASTAKDEAAIEDTTKTSQSEKNMAETETTATPKAASKTVTVPPVTKVSEKSKAVVEKELIKEWTAEKIRENLTSTNYGIDQAELKSYSDQELSNAFKLFVRYNLDVTGTDLGFYVHTLRMVYKDKTVSWLDIEKALAFNPHEYQTTDELAENIDQLQMYLRILYPDTKHFTNEELIYILNDLKTKENLHYPNGLFSGILFSLDNYPDSNIAKPTGLNHNSTIAAKPLIQTVANVPVSTASAKTEAAVQTTDQKQYPKTGERNTLPITLAGIALFLISGILILKRRIRS
ncbi:LPXTG cell wall anchor domain-containing protein [Candidatus Enterococcus murrayae]|nr:LPXTG cell wall anchor domain-containing protein [Enterococcus sp. MJM16]